MTPREFRYAFAGFVLAAMACAVPYCYLIHSAFVLADISRARTQPQAAVTLGRDRGPAGGPRYQGTAPKPPDPGSLMPRSVGRLHGVRHVRRPSSLKAVEVLPGAASGPYSRWEASAYSHSCVMPRSGIEGPPQPGADGRWPVPNLTVAADPSIPFGTVLEIAHGGVVSRRVVGDRGRVIRGRVLDLFVEDCARAIEWGRREVMVRVVADGGME